MNTLKIALIHFAPEHKQKEKNVKALLALNTQAAAQGARILVNTELAITGYFFKNREDVASMVEQIPGPTTEVFSELARQWGVYLALGLPETTGQTQIYYNSAVLLDPSGKLALRYRKVNTEVRWACPGSSHQKNIAQTPWGRLGMLVCSDAYHSLMPRVTALHGADLILVPTNWPTSGYFPRRIWRARAYENQLYLAACNRGGVGPHMDARNSHSGLYAPDGRVVQEQNCADTQIVFCNVPLHRGRIRPSGRRALKRARRPDIYQTIYLDLWPISDLTSFYGLPEPGPITVGAIPVKIARSASAILEMLHHKLTGLTAQLDVAVLPGAMFQLPDSSLRIDIMESMRQISQRFNTALSWGYEIRTGRRKTRFVVMTCPGQTDRTHRDTHFIEDKTRFEVTAFPMRVNIGPAQLGITSVNELLQPEISIGLSKLGVDLILSSGDSLSAAGREVLSTRSFDFAHVAAAGSDWALIALAPAGHDSWRILDSEGEAVVATVDTIDARKKRFQDRIAVEQLLEP